MVRSVSRCLRERAPITFGLALVENAYDETALIEAETWLPLYAGLQTLFILWVAALAYLRSQTNPRRDWGWVWPVAFLCRWSTKRASAHSLGSSPFPRAAWRSVAARVLAWKMWPSIERQKVVSRWVSRAT